MALGRQLAHVTLAAVLGAVPLPVQAEDGWTAFLEAMAGLAAAGPARAGSDHPLAGPLVRISDGRADIADHAVAASLHLSEGEGLRLVIVDHGQREMDIVLRGTQGLRPDGATLQIADIDRENATPEVLVSLAADPVVRLIVATQKSDGPGWEISPAVLSLAPDQAIARDIDGDGQAELVLDDPKTTRLALPPGLPTPQAVLVMRATAWLDAGSVPQAAPVHRATLSGLVQAGRGQDLSQPLLTALVAVNARLGRLDETWSLMRRLDLGGRPMREAILADLSAAGYVPDGMSLDPRRPGDRSR